MNWKCRFGFHDWSNWETIDKWKGIWLHITQEKKCAKCNKVKLKEITSAF